MASRGRAVHKRAQSVPRSNSDHKRQKLGYAGSAGDKKPFTSLQELNRSGQIGYCDVAVKTEWESMQIFRSEGVVNVFDNHGKLVDKGLCFICWKCGESLVCQKVSKTAPEFRCTACKDRNLSL